MKTGDFLGCKETSEEKCPKEPVKLPSHDVKLAGKTKSPFDCIAILNLMSGAIVPIYLGTLDGRDGERNS